MMTIKFACRSLVQVIDKLQSFARFSLQMIITIVKTHLLCGLVFVHDLSFSVNPNSLSNVLMALTCVIGQHSSEMGSESFSHLLELVESFTAILLGSQQTATLSTATTSIMQTLLESNFEDLHLAVVISVPELMGSMLALQWDGLDDTATRKLVALVDSLFEHYQRYAAPPV